MEIPFAFFEKVSRIFIVKRKIVRAYRTRMLNLDDLPSETTNWTTIHISSWRNSVKSRKEVFEYKWPPIALMHLISPYLHSFDFDRIKRSLPNLEVSMTGVSNLILSWNLDLYVIFKVIYRRIRKVIGYFQSKFS